MPSVSGLAASIRSSTESDTFDLAGQNATTITNTVTAAFTEPFQLSEMIRITLITGAGKLGRQKYDENAAKVVTTALRSLGFEDDSSASCDLSSAGTFKLQHDTGKNLKTVVIFPKVHVVSNDQSNIEEGMDQMSLQSSSLLREGSPEHTCAILSVDAFTTLLKNKCKSWSQKRECLHALTNIVEMLKGVDDKLMNGQAVSDEEQDLYDNLSLDLLLKKEVLLKKEMHSHVESGNITSYEQKKLVEQVIEKMKSLKDEISQAKKENKPKKEQKLTDMLEKGTARKEMLQKIQVKPPQKLKREAEILKLRKELMPLFRLENGAKGRLLTIKETQALGRKQEIEDEIVELENQSREWFEEDAHFEFRVKTHRDAIRLKEKQTQAKQTKKAPAASGYKTKPITWANSSNSKPASRKPTQKKSNNGNSGSVFSAMLMDSDDDE